MDKAPTEDGYFVFCKSTLFNMAGRLKRILAFNEDGTDYLKGADMLFNSIDFLVFFPIVVLVYFIVPKKIRYIWLLFASYYFYMCWNAKYVLLLMLSTVTTWLAGRLISICTRSVRKKVLLIGCVGINLMILFFFKYLGFFFSSLNRVLSLMHMQVLEKPFDLLLPVGISFYTFQALGYIADVYKGRIKAEKNLLRYALFVSFFPQLVAGPIERTENLLKQMQEISQKKVWDYENVTNGLITMIWGLFVKMVISDRVAILVDNVFDNFYMYGTVALLAGSIGFALQIYCDFMGYSTIAKGAAKVMGFELMENFETPYFSKSVSEFWRRWHISLSTWFRDYVYIPLGGNRCSKLRKYFNLMVTFGVSGLWHGASWNYVAWGVMHGVFQVVGDFTKSFRKRIYEKGHFKVESISFKLAQIVSTFFLVDFAWIFFRAGSLKIALDYCKRIFTKWDPWSLFNGEIYTLGLDITEFNILVVSVLILFLADLIRYIKKQDVAVFLSEQCIWFRWSAVILLIGAILVYGIYGIQFDSSQFIYFQF